MLLILLLFLPSVLLLLTMYSLRKKKPLSKKWVLFFLIGYLFFTLVYFLLHFLSDYNYYLRGYRSTSIIFLTMNLFGIIYSLTDRSLVLNKFFKMIVVLYTLITVTVGSCLAMDMIARYRNDFCYSDKKYRLEWEFGGIKSRPSPPVLYVKYGIIERKYRYRQTEEWINFTKREVNSCEIKDANRFFVRVDYSLNTDTTDTVVSLVYKLVK